MSHFIISWNMRNCKWCKIDPVNWKNIRKVIVYFDAYLFNFIRFFY